MKTRSQKMFIGCLPAESSEKELYSYFSKFAKISNLKLKYRSNNLCAGHGSFLCEEPHKVEILTDSSHFYRGRSLECRPFFSGEELREYRKKFNRRRVYVGNLPPNTTDLRLFEVFSRFGELVRAYTANNPDKRGRTFGFVVFRSEGVSGDLIGRDDLFMDGYRLEINGVTNKREIRGGAGRRSFRGFEEGLRPHEAGVGPFRGSGRGQGSWADEFEPGWDFEDMADFRLPENSDRPERSSGRRFVTQMDRWYPQSSSEVDFDDSELRAHPDQNNRNWRDERPPMTTSRHRERHYEPGITKHLPRSLDEDSHQTYQKEISRGVENPQNYEREHNRATNSYPHPEDYPKHPRIAKNRQKPQNPNIEELDGFGLIQDDYEQHRLHSTESWQQDWPDSPSEAQIQLRRGAPFMDKSYAQEYSGRHLEHSYAPRNRFDNKLNDFEVSEAENDKKRYKELFGRFERYSHQNSENDHNEEFAGAGEGGGDHLSGLYRPPEDYYQPLDFYTKNQISFKKRPIEAPPNLIEPRIEYERMQETPGDYDYSAWSLGKRENEISAKMEEIDYSDRQSQLERLRSHYLDDVDANSTEERRGALLEPQNRSERGYREYQHFGPESPQNDLQNLERGENRRESSPVYHDDPFLVDFLARKALEGYFPKVDQRSQNRHFEAYPDDYGTRNRFYEGERRFFDGAFDKEILQGNIFLDFNNSMNFGTRNRIVANNHKKGNIKMNQSTHEAYFEQK